MPNQIVLSTPAVAGLPVQSGNRTLLTPANVTAAAPTGAAINTSCDTVAITLINTGTLDNAASLALQAQINGSSFFPVMIGGVAKVWTGAQINAGVFETLNIKAQQIRFVLTPGTTSGANGVVPRVLD